MPRRNGVYRKIKMLKVECLTIDVAKEKQVKRTLLIPASYQNNALAGCRKYHQTEDNLIVLVKNIIGIEEVSYFMDLDKYIKESEVLNNGQKNA